MKRVVPPLFPRHGPAASGTARRGRVVVAVTVAVSVLVPGLAHLRLGAVADGVAYLLLFGVLSAVQIAAPLAERPASAALHASLAFGLGWVVSLQAARSAVRLVRS